MSARATVRTIPNKGQGLVAIGGTFREGDEIISESPLGEIPGTLMEIFDEDSFYDARHRKNGLHVIDIMVGSMSAPNRQLFNQLHSTDGTNPDIVLHNAFSNYSIVEGQHMHEVRVYNKISRANNSCEPNAMYSYNSTTGLGALRAIRSIPSGTEITIEYQALEEDSLRFKTHRRTKLRKQYSFVCSCTACQASTAVGRERDTAGVQAKQAELDRQSIPANGGTEAARVQRLVNLDTYITSLRNLDIRDFKLSNAYVHRAEVHRQGYELAKGNVAVHCATCIATNTPWGHLEQAQNDLLKALRNNSVCYGLEHLETEEICDLMAQVARLMVGIPLP